MRFFFALLFLSANSVFCQTDSTKKTIEFKQYKPLIVLSKSQIEKFPASNFMEIVNGMFPFVYGDPLYVSDYSFVVDGFVTINPNAISISQIDKIEFYPQGNELAKGMLIKKGVFVIHTIQTEEKNRLSFDTKTGIVYPNDKYPYGVASNFAGMIKQKRSLFSYNDLNYRSSFSGFFLNSAFSYTRNDFPEATTNIYTRQEEFGNQFDRYRFSNFASYEFSKKLKITGAFSYTRLNQENDYLRTRPTDTTRAEFDSATNYTNAAISISYSPVSQFENAISGEGNFYHTKDTFNSLGTPLNYYSFSKSNGRVNYFTILDHATVKFLYRYINIEGSLLFRYIWRKEDYTNYAITTVQGNLTSLSQSRGKYELKNTSISPTIRINWRNMLFFQTGFTFENYLYPIFYFNTKKKLQSFYDLGMRMELAPVIHFPLLSQLNFYFNYKTFGYWLYRPDPLDQENLTVHPGMPFNQPDKKITLIMGGAGFGLWADRFIVRANYLKENGNLITWIIAPSSTGYSGYNIFEPVKRYGWSFEMVGSIVTKRNLNWKIQTSLFNEKYQKDTSLIMPTIAIESEKPQWKGGLRTDFSYKNIFFQASALFSFNEFRRISTFEPDFFSNHRINFLLAGYRMGFKNSFLEQLDLSIQFRNLVLPESTNAKAYRNLYAGIGIKADVK